MTLALFVLACTRRLRTKMQKGPDRKKKRMSSPAACCPHASQPRASLRRCDATAGGRTGTTDGRRKKARGNKSEGTGPTASRAWKLFLLAPRMLLARPEQQSSEGRATLLARAAAFQRGEWTQVLAARGPVHELRRHKRNPTPKPSPSVNVNGHARECASASSLALGKCSRQRSSRQARRPRGMRSPTPPNARPRHGSRRPRSCSTVNPSDRFSFPPERWPTPCAKLDGAGRLAYPA